MRSLAPQQRSAWRPRQGLRSYCCNMRGRAGQGAGRPRRISSKAKTMSCAAPQTTRHLRCGWLSSSGAYPRLEAGKPLSGGAPQRRKNARHRAKLQERAGGGQASPRTRPLTTGRVRRDGDPATPNKNKERTGRFLWRLASPLLVGINGAYIGYFNQNVRLKPTGPLY